MPIGIIAAPLERKAGVDVPAVAVAVAEPVLFVRQALIAELDVAIDLYRPPPKDRRVDRIANRVFRV
jgi:hypothetical protein